MKDKLLLIKSFSGWPFFTAQSFYYFCQ